MKEEPSIPLSDFIRLLRRYKKSIGWTVFGFICLGAFTVLNKPLNYTAEATFKDSAPKSGMPSLFKEMFVSVGQESDSKSLLTLAKSKRVLIPVIQKQGSQLSIQEAQIYFPRLKTMWLNFKIQLAKFRGREIITPSYQEPLFIVSDVMYDEEIGENFTIAFDTDDEFTLLDAKNSEIGRGKLGDFAFGPNFSFKIASNTTEALKGRVFKAGLTSVEKAFNDAIARLISQPNKKDPKVIEFKYSHPDRHHATWFVNTLLVSLNNFLKEQSAKSSEEQLFHLEMRQNQLITKVENMLTDSAREYATRLEQGDFISPDGELKFVAEAQGLRKARLNKINLELKLLEEYPEKKTYCFLPNTAEYEIYAQLREHKMRSDVLNLALQKTEIALNRPEEVIEGQSKQLEEVRQEIDKLEGLLAQVVTKDEVRFADSAPFPAAIESWQSKLMELKACIAAKDNSEKKVREYAAQKESFVYYLKHVLRILHFKEKILHDRMARMQSATPEFLGIDLETANNLYIEYQKQLDGVEIDVHQLRSVLPQIREGEFEISALVNTLRDSISQARIQEASSLLLSMLDQHNRTTREHGRLKDQLMAHREFIALHVGHTIEMLELQQEVLKEKIRTLQEVTLELTCNQMSILEKQLEDSVHNRIVHLRNEKEMLREHEVEQGQQMAYLPERWMSEKRTQFLTTMYTGMADGIAKAVESKILSNIMESIESKPLDFATTPIKPVIPSLPLHIFLWGSLGGLMAVAFVLTRGVVNGLAVSPEQLGLTGSVSLGSLQDRLRKITDVPTKKDENVLRKIALNIEQKKREKEAGLLVLSLLNRSANYLPYVALLLKKTGLKVAIVDLEVFSEGGLTDAAEKGDILIKTQSEYADEYSAGSDRVYLAEILRSNQARAILKALTSEYDVVFLKHSGSLFEPLAESAFDLSDFALVSLREEKAKQIQPFIQKSSAFIFSEDALNR